MMKFKTSAKCAGCEAAIKKALAPLGDESKWNINLKHPDKILTWLGDVPSDAKAFADKVKELVATAGHKAERID